ncbi:non-heme iron oxygenase ferredoxin subunit [Luedemannella flava]|uniref:Non-heme iron oxygenase ferredoxin subunit n=1 Tax=Luedemannella flava TaxID=349316 RepID=A0ABP4YPA6_9ACTN
MSSELVEISIGSLESLPIGEGRTFTIDGDMVAIFRTRTGVVHAVSAVCPHAGGPIADGLADTEVVICPLHQHVFELTTGCSRSGQPPLRVYPVRVTDAGEVLVGAPVPVDA